MNNIYKFFCVLILVFILAVSTIEVSKSAVEGSLGVVAGIKGKLTVKRAEEAMRQEAFLRMQLYEGDIVETARNSKGCIVFKDGTHMKLNELTSVTLVKSQKTSKMSAKKLPSLIKVLVGEIWMQIKKQKGKAEIETPVAVAAIRGTELDVKVEEAGRTIFTVVDGEVELKNNYGMVILKNSEQSIVEAGKAPLPPQKIEVEQFIRWIKDVRLHLTETIPLSFKNLQERTSALGKAEDMIKAGESVGTANLILGKVALDNGDLEKAKEYFKQAGLNGIKSPELYLRIADIDFLNEDWDSARTKYTEIINKFPEESYGYSRLAKVEMGELNLTDASDLFNKALKLRKDNVEAIIGLGICNFLEGNFIKALKHFKKALKADPLNSTAYQDLAMVYSILGREEESLSALNKAIELDPSNVELIINLGAEYGKQKNFNEAEKFLKTALEKASSPMQRFACYSNLANIYFQQNNFEECFSTELKALELNPDSSIDKEKLATITRIYVSSLFKNGEIDKAQKCLELVSPFVAEFGDYHLLQGELYYIKKDFEKAKEDLIKATELSPDDPFGYYFLAMTNCSLNFFDEAKKQFEKALELFEKQGNEQGANLIKEILNNFKSNQ